MNDRVTDTGRSVDLNAKCRLKMIKPFVGAQADICDAFGFKIQGSCTKIHVSRQKRNNKRGTPLKKLSGEVNNRN